MKDFLFLPEQTRSPVSVLSGGERARLLLARALALPSNLLVLDEPTNDLDLETLDLLQELLGDYPGTVLLVSHDRDFLDRIVTSTIAFEGDGRWLEYAGGYSDMLSQRGIEPAQIAGRDKKQTKPPKDAVSSSSLAATPASAKRKLSFKEKHALEQLPGLNLRCCARKLKRDDEVMSSDSHGIPAAHVNSFPTETSERSVAVKMNAG